MDDALLQRAHALDEEALTHIYNAYFERLYRYAYRFVSDGDTAQDIAAETLLRWLTALRDGRPPRNLGAWLYRVAHNLAMDVHRRRPSGGTVPLDPELIQTEGSDTRMDMEGRLTRARVRAAVLELTPEQQDVIVLKFLEGYSNSEVAALMDRSEGAIKALQHRALAALRRAFS
jgi:RNA polymerase sigma-70 factor (ECF subfamily)